MTKDEFIDGYMSRSQISSDDRTPNGFIFADNEFIAEPCECGDEICTGWSVVNITDRNKFEQWKVAQAR